jgi:hypothetical protein
VVVRIPADHTDSPSAGTGRCEADGGGEAAGSTGRSSVLSRAVLRPSPGDGFARVGREANWVRLPGDSYGPVALPQFALAFSRRLAFDCESNASPDDATVCPLLDFRRHRCLADESA